MRAWNIAPGLLKFFLKKKMYNNFFFFQSQNLSANQQNPDKSIKAFGFKHCFGLRNLFENPIKG